jgi:hypothetical protein
MSDTVQRVNRILNPSSIDSFKALINARRGLARANRFMVIMQPPSQTLFTFNLGSLLYDTIIGGKDINYRDFIADPRDIAMLCESSSFPGRQIQTMDYILDRQPKKVPMAYINEDVTMVFHLTSDYYVKRLFTEWSDLVIDPASYKLRYDSEFKTDIIVQQLDSQNLPVYGILLKNAYPVGVNSVILDVNDQTTQRLTVQFTFDDQEEIGAGQSIVTGASNVVGGLLRRLI